MRVVDTNALRALAPLPCAHASSGSILPAGDVGPPGAIILSLALFLLATTVYGGPNPVAESRPGGMGTLLTGLEIDEYLTRT
jgi:hypothetical protein